MTTMDIREAEVPLAAPSNPDWLDDFFQAADSLDIERALAWFTDDVELRFANDPAVIGKAGARATLSGFWATISGMRHEQQVVVQQNGLAVQMGLVTYRRLDGSTVALPVASHLRRAEDGRVDRLWVFIDLAPLFSSAH